MFNKLVASIIDDDESVRIATSSLVRSLGWEVQVFGSGEQFLDADDIGAFACIISDVQMPGISGVEMYRRLLGRGVVLPVIFISAYASDVVRRQALEVGALCILSKPVDGGRIAQYLIDIEASDAAAHP